MKREDPGRRTGFRSRGVPVKKFGIKAGVTVSNKYQIQLRKSICCRENPEVATIGVMLKKACKSQYWCFPVNVAKLLRIYISKSICEQLLKIRISAANLPKGGIS